nr:integrase, catalytic region, zinc finger, CCHC-type, peptidase aspartic, catalytic [Tanacetum cinerariifolium]
PSGYMWKPKSPTGNVNPNVSMPLGNASRTANVKDTMTSRHSIVSNSPLSSNYFAAHRDCSIHHLEVAFRKSMCFIRDLKGNDLITGSRGTDLYSITLQDSNSPNLICLMAKATSSQAWLWHHRLSHLNFDTINLLSKNDIVVGLSKDGENLDKMKEKGDECIFVGYSTQSRAYRVFNKRTRVIMESIHVNFDELLHMALVQISSDPVPECQSMALEYDSLSPGRKYQENVSHGDKIEC